AQITLSLSPKGILDYFVVSHWWENARNNTSPIPGTALYLLACVLFILGMSRLGDDSIPVLPIHLDNHPQIEPKFGFWVTSLFISGALAVCVSQITGNGSVGYFFLAIWILSIVLFVISVVIQAGWQHPTANIILAWLKEHRAELVVITAII